jgi:hypothetical protein
MRHTRGGAVALLLVAATCAALLVLRGPSVTGSARGTGAGARRQAQGTPPAPVPLPGIGSAVALASKASGARCFNAIPGNHILHEPPAPGSCRKFVAVVPTPLFLPVRLSLSFCVTYLSSGAGSSVHLPREKVQGCRGDSVRGRVFQDSAADVGEVGRDGV